MTTLNQYHDDPDVYPKRLIMGPPDPRRGEPSKDYSWIIIAVNYQNTWMIVDTSQGFKDNDIFSETVSGRDEGFCGVGMVLPELKPGIWKLTEIAMGGCHENYWGDDWSDWEIEPKKITQIA